MAVAAWDDVEPVPDLVPFALIQGEPLDDKRAVGWLADERGITPDNVRIELFRFLGYLQVVRLQALGPRL